MTRSRESDMLGGRLGTYHDSPYSLMGVLRETLLGGDHGCCRSRKADMSLKLPHWTVWRVGALWPTFVSSRRFATRSVLAAVLNKTPAIWSRLVIKT